MPDAVSYPRQRGFVLADLLPGTIVRDAALVITAAGFVGLLAQFSIRLSFTPVPITGQTLGVVLAGTALGARRGAFSMVLYGLLGVIGVPWFADHTSGYVGATFGYVVGFVACAAVCGTLAERGTDRSIIKSIPAMVTGEIVLYVFGVLWLRSSLHVDIGEAISLGLTPFLIGDAIKIGIAAVLLPSTWKMVGERKPSRERFSR